MKFYIDNKAWKLIVFLSCILLVTGFCVFDWMENSNKCLGVSILSIEDAKQYTEYEYLDFDEIIKHKGEIVALDKNSSTIYISQNIQADTLFTELQGNLTIEDAKYQLFFYEDNAFYNLAEAVKDGHAFQLIVTDGSKKYMQYNVVFTTLPVIRMDGEVTHKDEEGRDVLTGDVCVWTAKDPEVNAYTVKSSDLEWHHRGGTTADLEKKSWKLSLKQKNGENQNLAFCGLGADDDWILNAMALDDTKMREKLFMDLWNEVASQNTYSYKMSTGEYVEVVANGEYLGLYLMQRRIDSKYLELGEDTAIIRGLRVVTVANSVDEALEVIDSSLTEEETLEMMYALYSGISYMPLINVDNFIDVNLFVKFAVAPDNAYFNNMFWVVEKHGDAYMLKMVPWDTDMSFGASSSGFSEAEAIYGIAERMETGYMTVNVPGYLDGMLLRWNELRDGVLETENVLSYLEAYNEELTYSGALNRNVEKWGLQFEGTDSYKVFREIIESRLEYMDLIYQES